MVVNAAERVEGPCDADIVVSFCMCHHQTDKLAEKLSAAFDSPRRDRPAFPDKELDVRLECPKQGLYRRRTPHAVVQSRQIG